jgi:hypothetical protein
MKQHKVAMKKAAFRRRRLFKKQARSGFYHFWEREWLK